MTTRAVSFQRVDGFERECGPWFATDWPEDIFDDIRLFDPDSDITLEDVIVFCEIKFCGEES